MALITRISRMFKADFHAVLDQVEEPRTLLRQAIRDMEEDLSTTQLRQQQMLKETDELKSRHRELEQTIKDHEDQLDICFESGEEMLARDLIKRKLQTERLSSRVSSRLGAADKELQCLNQSLNENRATLESLQQKAELFPEQSQTMSGGSDNLEELSWNAREATISDADVEIAFLREKKRRAKS